MASTIGRRYGWHPPVPDKRDRRLADLEPHLNGVDVPPMIDLRPQMPPVYDQGQLGSCTANSIAAGVQFLQTKQGIPSFNPSRLFIYYQERLDQGDVIDDTGSSIRESAKAVAIYGAPPEADWGYSIALFATRPPAKAYADALKTKVTQYLAVGQNAAEMKACLAAGYPVHVGFSVYESFETADVARTGIVPMPKPGERLLGGHAVVVAGYNDPAGVWLCRNSWGTGWGSSGYFTMPYAYLLDPQLSSDFWTLRQVTGPTPPAPPQPVPVAPAKIDGLGFHFDDGTDIQIGAADLEKVLKAWAGK